MKHYETLPINRWSIPRYKAVSDDAKVLLLYLNLNSDTGLINLPPLSMEWIAIDLGWKRERIERRLSELMAHQLIDLSDDKQELFIKPFQGSRKLDKPCLIHRRPLSQHQAESCSWRDKVRAKFYSTSLNSERGA